MASTEHRRVVQGWLKVAVGSLVLAGLFSLLLVIGRTPPFSSLFTDPLFFRRGLVVHVDLALLVWFHAFAAALISGLPAAGPPGRLAALGPKVAGTGVCLLVVAAALPGARPILSNYVPLIDHPLFTTALVVFGAGVLMSVLSPRLWRPASEIEADALLDLPPAARPGLRGAALALLVASLTFFAASLSAPDAVGPEARAEALVWGGGHILQFASVAAMLSVWLMLLTPALGESPVSRRAAVFLFALLLLPTLGAPAVAGYGVVHAEAHAWFTDLMRWTIFPVVLVVMGLCLRALFRARRRGVAVFADARVLGFLASAGLTVLGFVLGAMIRGHDTMIPGHYHAAIGAVTVAFMTVTWPVAARLGLTLPEGRLSRARRWQPLAFGLGQSVFALGFSLAGAQGALRKTYGTEQHIRTATEWLGLTAMGLGGVIAIVAGLTFLAMAVAAARPHTPWRRPAWHPIRTH